MAPLQWAGSLARNLEVRRSRTSLFSLRELKSSFFWKRFDNLCLECKGKDWEKRPPRSLLRQISLGTGRPGVPALLFIDCALQTLCTLEPCLEQAYQSHFSKSTCSLFVFVSHFDNFLNISRFFIALCFHLLWCCVISDNVTTRTHWRFR